MLRTNKTNPVLLAFSVGSILFSLFCINVNAAGLQVAPAMPMSNSAVLNESQKARMVLDRLGFGARPGEVEKVRAIGVSNWIEHQLNPQKIPDPLLASRLKGMTVPAKTTAQLYAQYPNPASIRRQIVRNEGGKNAVAAEQAAGNNDYDKKEMRRKIAEIYQKNGYGRPQEIYLQLAADRLLRATYSERQLQEVMVDFWSNHFNVYAKKNISQWFLPTYDRETIRPYVLGNFRDLLMATAKSPAMLFYLDTFESVAATSASTENPGRRDLSQVSDTQLKRGLMKRRSLSSAQADEQVSRLRANPAGQVAKKKPNGINENYARELMELHGDAVEIDI